MVTIAQNARYELRYNPTKNRLYLRIIGFWPTVAAVPEYLADWKEALALTKPGFTLVTDAREMVIHPAEVRVLHEEAQKMITAAGSLHTAEIVKAANVSELQLDLLSKETGMPRSKFTAPDVAEAWLDELVARSGRN